MPAFITHQLHAQQVCARLREAGAEFDEQALALGAQGPDFLYFHRALPLLQPGRSRRAVGTALHELPADRVFGAAADYLRANTEKDSYPTAHSYTLGFLCHYSLDRTAHPFIYAQQRQFIQRYRVRYFEGLVHSRLEHSLDTVVLRTLEGSAANRYRVDRLTPRNKTLLTTAAALLEYVAAHSDAGAITARQIVTAFGDNRALQRLSYDPHGIKRTAVRVTERIFFLPQSLSTFIRPRREDNAWDYANLAHAPWCNPFEPSAPPRTEDFMQLLSRSVEDSLTLIAAFNASLGGTGAVRITDNISCKTGLPISADGH